MARSNKIGDSSHLSLNEDLVYLFSIINLEIKLQINASSRLQDHLMILRWGYAKAQDVVETTNQTSIKGVETVQKKLPQCGIFHGLSINFTT